MAVVDSSSLRELIDTFRVLIEFAEGEQWDALSPVENKINALLVELAKNNEAASREQLQEALALQQKAISLCRKRMTCIESLIRAFDKIEP